MFLVLLTVFNHSYLQLFDRMYCMDNIIDPQAAITYHPLCTHIEFFGLFRRFSLGSPVFSLHEISISKSQFNRVKITGEVSYRAIFLIRFLVLIL